MISTSTCKSSSASVNSYVELINNNKIPSYLEHCLEDIFHESDNFFGSKIDNIDTLLSKAELDKNINNPIPHAKDSFLARLGGRRICDLMKQFIHSQGFELHCDPDYTSGCFYYPPSYGFMGWHTNHNDIGYRLYIAKSLNGDSFFRYYKDNKIHTCYDPVGYSFRAFLVSDEQEPYWHCVHGGSGRFSIGFHLKKSL